MGLGFHPFNRTQQDMATSVHAIRAVASVAIALRGNEKIAGIKSGM
jgi:hypothetical protein